MIKSRHIWAGAAALALIGVVPATVSAQSAKDPHAGHPAKSAAPANPAPAPTAQPAKPDDMTGSGPGTKKGMGAEDGKMPMMKMADGMDMPMDCMASGKMQMPADVEGRIASLRTGLKITGAQVDAWNAFADVLRANARRAGPVHAAMMSRPEDGAPVSLEKRLDLREQALTTSLTNLRALKPVLARLYVVLSAEQKATADRLLVHETGMMSGMPMSGMCGGMTKQ